MSYVEEQRAAGLLHVHGELAGEHVADVVLWAENVCDAAEELGLVGADPEKLRKGEVRQRGIAGELDQASAADLGFQPVTLWLGTLVAPDERGAEDFPGGVEHDAAVHLAGEANGLDLTRGNVGLSEGSADGFASGAPPVCGVLLGPPYVLGVDGGVLAGTGSDDVAGAVDEHGAGAAGADVDAKKHGTDLE